MTKGGGDIGRGKNIAIEKLSREDLQESSANRAHVVVAKIFEFREEGSKRLGRFLGRCHVNEKYVYEERNKRDKAVSIPRGHQNCITSHLSPFFSRAIDETKNPIRTAERYISSSRSDSDLQARMKSGRGRESIGVMEETLKRSILGENERKKKNTTSVQIVPLLSSSALLVFLRLLSSISRLITQTVGLLETG